MADRKLVFSLWDVGHGVSIWINTPNDTNHWIDLGRTPEFSPSEHVGHAYHVSDIDYLVISHADKDHLEDPPQFRETFGDPRVLRRNRSLPATNMFGQRTFQYQREYADLHNRFTAPITHAEDPTNPDCNGGVRYAIHSLDYGTRVNGSTVLGSAVIEGNDTSIVVMLLYEGVLFVCPGDIEPLGWCELWRRHVSSFRKPYRRCSLPVPRCPASRPQKRLLQGHDGGHPTACHLHQRCLGSLRDPSGLP